MLMFRSKYRQRRFSNDLNIYKQINFHSDKINFHAVSYTLLIIITSLSSRYGKWILFAYSVIFMMTTMISYCTNIRNSFYNELLRIRSKLQRRLNQAKSVFSTSLAYVDKLEREYLKLNNVSATLSQIVFFVACGKVLLRSRNVTALYSLLFYNLLSYCVTHVRQLYNSTKWSLCINVASHSNVKHLAMSAMKIVLEVTHVIAIVSMIFALCLEPRGEPTKLFTLLTFVYYLATETKFAESLQIALGYLQLSYFDNLETLWTPVLLSVTSQCLSLCFATILFCDGYYRAALVCFYVNVYLNYRKLSTGSLRVLNEEKKVVSQYRYATKLELENFEDVCAVCLTDMRHARITPCHHMFHTDCLRKCLLSCDKCPVCKRELIFS